VTECLYSKPKKSSEKTINILLKSIPYFDMKNVWLPIKREALHEQIKVEYPSVQIHKTPYDLVFIDILDLNQEFENLSSNIHNDTLLLIDSIYKTKISVDLWNEFKNHKQVTISIDMYHCGAVFFRKEQVKEHFKIRI